MQGSVRDLFLYIGSRVLLSFCGRNTSPSLKNCLLHTKSHAYQRTLNSLPLPLPHTHPREIHRISRPRPRPLTSKHSIQHPRHRRHRTPNSTTANLRPHRRLHHPVPTPTPKPPFRPRQIRINRQNRPSRHLQALLNISLISCLHVAFNAPARAVDDDQDEDEACDDWDSGDEDCDVGFGEVVCFGKGRR